MKDYIKMRLALQKVEHVLQIEHFTVFFRIEI